MRYSFQPSGVCARAIHFDLEGDVVTNIQFDGGCPGNLKAISKILDGWTVGRIEETLKGNTCGHRPTSCADQLATGVRLAYDKEHAE